MKMIKTLNSIRLHGKKAEQKLSALTDADTFEILSIMSDHPGITQSNLIELTGIGQVQMSLIMSKLKKHGYVSSTKNKKHVHYSLNIFALEDAGSVAKRLAAL